MPLSRKKSLVRLFKPGKRKVGRLQGELNYARVEARQVRSRQLQSAETECMNALPNFVEYKSICLLTHVQVTPGSTLPIQPASGCWYAGVLRGKL